jgi:predicted RNA-binding Zn-ribbon protein involved in translation (DUF1610 family)
MTAPNAHPPTPSRDDPGTTRRPPRDDSGTNRCPVCQARFTPMGRQAYCSTACRKTAFRRRHHQPAAAVTVPAAQPRRQITVYECPDCGERLLGEQRCEGCNTFARRVGIGGSCPHCDEPVAIKDLINETTVTTAPTRPAR